MADSDRWNDLANQLRVDSIRMADTAGSGHPTSSMSAAELTAVLFDKYLRYDFDNPDDPNNDHVIFSKGHASPLLYALFKAAGALDTADLESYRKRGSRLEGHPAPVLPWIDVATGSLGQGLPIGVGVALAARDLDRLDYRTWVLCGDSEMSEGSMWEAFEHAGHAGLDNLVAVIDVNRLGQTRETRYGWDLEAFVAKAVAFGWATVTIDGHDVDDIDRAYETAVETFGRPVAVIAETRKGAGADEVEDRAGKHGKPLDDAEAAIREIGEPPELRFEAAKPEAATAPRMFPTEDVERPTYGIGDGVPTRNAYGRAITALGKQRPHVVALDGEVGNSTRAEFFEDELPERFFEFYIAEQQMIAAAVGMQVRGWVPFAASFAAFLTRAHDFIRMAAVSRADMCVAGSHAGVSIGPDGPSQMGLEDLAMFRAVHGSTVFYPCDANQTTVLVERMADQPGISYIRTTRGKTPVIYEVDDDFRVGGSREVVGSDDDAVAVVAAGVTVHEAARAADDLRADSIDTRVIDAYSVKPLDVDTVLRAAAECPAGIVTVEDHRPEGGLGDAVLEALADASFRPPVRKLAVRNMPGSATPVEQRAIAGIDAAAIAEAARQLVKDAA